MKDLLGSNVGAEWVLNEADSARARRATVAYFRSSGEPGHPPAGALGLGGVSWQCQRGLQAVVELLFHHRRQRP
jgi:hypothetical protein